ncbi:MAG: hypothetical protein KTR18_06195 [Acidiferrobacterales bacterium]|nr:hypothetical protein [Acidiferrobacterales bacterium]
MGRKKANIEAKSSNDVDSVEGTEEFDSESVAGEVMPDLAQDDLSVSEDLDIVESPCNSMSAKAREKLETKKRLDAYLERQMLKESGWDEDDELFDDEFFTEVAHHRN